MITVVKVHAFKISFCSITGLAVEVSTTAVELNSSNTFPRVVSFRYSGTEARSLVPKLHKVDPPGVAQLVHNVVLDYEDALDSGGMISSTWNTVGRHSKEVVVAVWPQVLSANINFTLTLELVHRSLFTPHNLSRQSSIDFYFPVSMPTFEDTDMTTALEEGSGLLEGSAGSASSGSMPSIITTAATQAPSVSLINKPFIKSAGGIGTVTTLAIVAVAFGLILLTTAVSVFVTRRRKMKQANNSKEERV